MFLPLRVLILEDYEDDALLILRELRRGGFEPTHIIVETESAMSSALDIDDWDIILSDYSMPQFSAPAALKVLKRSNKDIPFIVVSGNVGEIVAVQLMQYGASDYVNKSNLSRLCPAIQREISESKIRKIRKESQTITTRLWDIFNYSMNEIYIFDAKNYLFKVVNQGGLRNLGYSILEMQNMHPWDIISGYNKDDIIDITLPLIEGEKKYLQLETNHIRKNGTQYPVEVRLQLSRGELEPIFFAIILDISERKKANNQIQSLAKFPEENPEPVLQITRHLDIIYHNPSSRHIKSFWDNFHRNKAPDSWQDVAEKCFHDNQHQTLEYAIEDKTYQWILFPSQEGSYINCYARDITEQIKSNKKLKQSALVFNHSQEGIMICDANFRVTGINKAFTKITGYIDQTIIGQSSDILHADRHGESFYKSQQEDIEKNGVWQGELWYRKNTGLEIPLYLSISVVREQDDEISGYISIFSDISESKQAQAHIHNLAYYDVLTELPNRLHLHEKLFDTIDEAEHNSESVAVIYIDLTRFKNINESMGHQTADRALKMVAKRLLNIMPKNAYVGRTGGDEFMVIAADKTIEAEDDPLIKKITDSFIEPFELMDQDIYIGTSIGVAHFPVDGEKVDILIKHAESAVAHGKQVEKYFSIFSKNMQVKDMQYISLETNLRRALERDEFVLYYQPKVDLKTNKIVGLEALIRWLRPEVGLVPPSDFIPLLEETGLIVAVGNWVIKEACRQIGEWKSIGVESPKIAVNLSARQFNQLNLVKTIKGILDDANVSSEMIELEVTESTIMRQYDNVIKILNELHNSNFLISIDDFGTGYSSLSYLKHFPIDVLKIDRSFVMEIPGDKDDIAIVNTIVSMGHNLNLQIVAEGVETDEQRECLKAMGCELAQGFFFSKPLPADEVLELIKTQPF